LENKFQNLKKTKNIASIIQRKGR